MDTQVLLAQANGRLDALRDALAHATDLNLLCATLPDWTLVAVASKRLHRALLRHTSDASRWLLVVGDRERLLPRRALVPGHNFRFAREEESRRRLVLGTAEEVRAYAQQRFDQTVWADRVYGWVLDHLDGETIAAERVLYGLTRDLEFEAMADQIAAMRTRR